MRIPAKILIVALLAHASVTLRAEITDSSLSQISEEVAGEVLENRSTATSTVQDIGVLRRSISDFSARVKSFIENEHKRITSFLNGALLGTIAAMIIEPISVALRYMRQPFQGFGRRYKGIFHAMTVIVSGDGEGEGGGLAKLFPGIIARIAVLATVASLIPFAYESFTNYLESNKTQPSGEESNVVDVINGDSREEDALTNEAPTEILNSVEEQEDISSVQMESAEETTTQDVTPEDNSSSSSDVAQTEIVTETVLSEPKPSAEPKETKSVEATSTVPSTEAEVVIEDATILLTSESNDDSQLAAVKDSLEEEEESPAPVDTTQENIEAQLEELQALKDADEHTVTE